VRQHPSQARRFGLAPRALPASPDCWLGCPWHQLLSGTRPPCSAGGRTRRRSGRVYLQE
jgi:hypothetical protein